jgi:hypothetical protein
MMIAEERDQKNQRRRRGQPGDAATACVLMTILLLALFPASGGANPPQEVVLSYDQAQHTGSPDHPRIEGPCHPLREKG